MIKTGRRRKVKKQKKQAKMLRSAASEDEDLDSNAEGGGDADFNPEKPDDLSEDEANGQIEDTFHDVEMDEESDREENVERQLNFNGEISMLINYDVVSRYMSVLDQTSNLSKQADLI